MKQNGQNWARMKIVIGLQSPSKCYAWRHGRARLNNGYFMGIQVQNMSLALCPSTSTCVSLTQLTFFGAWMAMSGRREAEGRHPIACTDVTPAIEAGMCTHTRVKSLSGRRSPFLD